jgi:hypothetical protein
MHHSAAAAATETLVVRESMESAEAVGGRSSDRSFRTTRKVSTAILQARDRPLTVAKYAP